MSDKRRAATSSIIADLHYCFCSLTVLLFLVQFLIRTITRSTARQRSCEKVMFLIMSVRHSVRGGCPFDHYLWRTGPHHTGRTPLVPAPPPHDMGPHYTGTSIPPSYPTACSLWRLYGCGSHSTGMLSCFYYWVVTSLKGQKYVGQSAGLQA